ncbi:hypothetical protein KAI52_00970 [Candidatus Parcubacteria bacterium]|nr:hypothetical protein [Candidatus Parcubacteria bacterium]
MTTITFKENIKIKKSKFENILDFKDYLEKHFYFTKLMELDDKETTLKMKRKISETKKLDQSHFVNI